MPDTALEYTRWLFLAAITVISAGRITRLVTYDKFPPIAAVRNWYSQRAKGNWYLLLECLWCFGPWATLVVGVWGLLSDFNMPWLLFNGWMTLSYLVSMLVVRDEPAGSDDDA